MTTEMPPLETERLLIRPFTLQDLPNVHQLLDLDLAPINPPGSASPQQGTLSERQRWLQWTVLSYAQLANLYQPPYGDRAIILKSSRRLIGACGFVPAFGPYQQLPGFSAGQPAMYPAPNQPEFGLYYAVTPSLQRLGYATEAANSLVDYAFQALHLKRVIATTTYDNLASMGVMRKLGMRILKNPAPEPTWLQVVGVLP